MLAMYLLVSDQIFVCFQFGFSVSKSFVRFVYVGTIFSLSGACLFTFLTMTFDKVRFNFDDIQFVIFPFIVNAFRFLSEKNICLSQVDIILRFLPEAL